MWSLLPRDALLNPPHYRLMDIWLLLFGGSKSGRSFLFLFNSFDALDRQKQNTLRLVTERQHWVELRQCQASVTISLRSEWEGKLFVDKTISFVLYEYGLKKLKVRMVNRFLVLLLSSSSVVALSLYKFLGRWCLPSCDLNDPLKSIGFEFSVVEQCVCAIDHHERTIRRLKRN